MLKTGKPKKIIVYLDQNVLSDTAKIGMNSKVRSDYSKLFHLLHNAFLEGQLVTLRSIHHEAETSMAGSLQDAIRQRLSSLSHVELQHPLYIKEMQIARALQLWLGQEGATNVVNFDDPFCDDPDGSVSLFDINVDMDWMFANVMQERQELAEKLDKVRAREKANRTKYVDLYKRELDWVRSDIAAPHNALRIAAMADTSVEQLSAFTQTEEFGAIPSVHLDVALLARLMTQHANRPIKRGDVADLEAIWAYLPYCDAYITDKLAANVARAVGADTLYDCALFDPTISGVAGLIEFLEQRLLMRQPVRQS
jgi:hypothetical protein